jgi:energy-coupling factor transport system permease protein
VIVIAVTITLKYIPTFKREFSYILESMRLRGINFTIKHPIKSFQYFIVPQLFRCAALAEEVTAAGYVKGIDVPVKRTSYFEEKVRVPDVAVLALFLVGLAGGFVWRRM